MSTRTIGAEEAQKGLPKSQQERSIALFQHGTLTVKLYAPSGKDPQMPHNHDEIYVVIHGAGDFVCAGTPEVWTARFLVCSRGGGTSI